MRRGVLALVPLLLLLSSCVQRPAAAPPEPDPVLAAGVQATLDQLSALLVSGSPAQAHEVGDPEDPLAQLILKELIDDVQQQHRAASELQGFRIIDLQPRGTGLLEATVRRPWDGWHTRWLFRDHEGSWLITQPTETEQGEEQTLQGDGFTLAFSPWDADLATALRPLLADGFRRVAKKLGVTDPASFTVRLRSRANSTQMLDRGLYVTGATPGGDTINLTTSGVVFGIFDPDQTWPEALAQVARHEYVHRLQDHTPVPVSLDDTPLWFTEGLAEALAGSEHLKVPAFRAVIDGGDLLSFCDLAAPPLSTERGVLYGMSQLAVSYMIEERGGLSAFWDVVGRYRQTSPGQRGTVRMETALRGAWQQSCADVDRDWHAWIVARRAHY